MRGVRYALAAVAVAGEVCLAAGCPGPAAARPQLLVFIDTDAHVVGELATRPEISPDATMDTLRIDVMGPTGGDAAYSINTFVVSDVSAWPLSIGVLPPSASSSVLLRIRLFRAQFAATDNVLGQATFNPPAEVTIDRLVSLPSPTAGVQSVRVVLSEDCLGSPAKVGAGSQASTTCIDAAQLDAGASVGLQSLSGHDLPASPVGTWAPAVEVRCKSTPTAGQICIPGGFAIIGDVSSVGVGSVPSFAYETLPLRPVVMSSYFLDKNEFTVGTLRALETSGSFTLDPSLIQPHTTAAQNEIDFIYCNWLGTTDGTNDDRPLNCITLLGAQQTCAAMGGYLPTEAQWEFAARGRGQRREYPWGDAPPACCSVSAGLYSNSGGDGGTLAGPCGDAGTEPVESHPASAACGDAGDVTRDGVWDMAGSVSEFTSSPLLPYSDTGSWYASAILHDPVFDAGNASPAARGGAWTLPLSSALLPVRVNYVGRALANSVGFRCAYSDQP